MPAAGPVRVTAVLLLAGTLLGALAGVLLVRAHPDEVLSGLAARRLTSDQPQLLVGS